MLIVFFVALIISLASFAGLVFVAKTSRGWMLRNIKFLITFSAGVLFMTALQIAGESFELLSKGTAIWSILGGFALLWIVQAIIPEVHHHHDEACPDCIPAKSSIKTLIGDAIHNIGDGILLVPAFTISMELGIATAISIFVHEFIQEISEFFVLRGAGFSTKKALRTNFLSSLTIFIGVAIGIFLVSSLKIQGILLGISAGAFLQIVVHDLFPFAAVKKVQSLSAWKHLGLFMGGIVIIALLGTIIPHEEIHTDTTSVLLETIN
jgi:zinc and cadmium transporter